MRRRNKIIYGIIFLVFAACSQQPAEIHYRSDECAHCKMMIMDPRFASQAVTETGKAIPFDAVECMVAYLDEQDMDASEVKLWVNDFNDPGHWIDAREAHYVKSEVIQSPMGESLLALETPEQVEDHLAKYDGQKVSWQRLKSH